MKPRKKRILPRLFGTFWHFDFDFAATHWIPMPVTVTQDMADEWNGNTMKLEARLIRLQKLVEDDDWAFIIKCHAVIEVFFTEMLVAILSKKEITSIVERLPLSDSRTGKATLAKNIGLLSEGHQRFIRLFSELRNSLVHNTDDFDFACASYFGSLNKDKSKIWKQTFKEILDDKLEPNWESAMFPSQGRTLLLMCVAKLLTLCYRHQIKPMGERWGFIFDKDGFCVGDDSEAASELSVHLREP